MPRTAEEVLQDEFLVARSKILELAATLDRLDRAGGSLKDRPQMRLLEEGIAILGENETGRAERMQLLMSRQYDSKWQTSKDCERK